MLTWERKGKESQLCLHFTSVVVIGAGLVQSSLVYLPIYAGPVSKIMIYQTQYLFQTTISNSTSLTTATATAQACCLVQQVLFSSILFSSNASRRHVILDFFSDSILTLVHVTVTVTVTIYIILYYRPYPTSSGRVGSGRVERDAFLGLLSQYSLTRVCKHMLPFLLGSSPIYLTTTTYSYSYSYCIHPIPSLSEVK